MGQVILNIQHLLYSHTFILQCLSISLSSFIIFITTLPLPDKHQLTGEDVFWFVEFSVWFNINRAQFKPWTIIYTLRDFVSTRLFSLSLNSSLCCLFGDDCSKTVAEALGESGQSISKASFNVPSLLHASSSGFQRSFCFLWFKLPVFR